MFNLITTFTCEIYHFNSRVLPKALSGTGNPTKNLLSGTDT